MQLPRIPIVVLDTETTGFIPRTHRIIEFACMRIENGEVVDEYEQLIRIPGEVPPHVVALTRIHPEALQDQPEMADVRQEILKRIGEDTLIVGQNVGFDIRMLKGEDIDLTDRPWIDTSMLASIVFPELESYSLGYMSQVLKLNHAPVHRALGDVRATAELLEHCWRRFGEITPELDAPLRAIMARAPEGYRRLFDALPPATAGTAPSWLHMPTIRLAEAVQDTHPLALPDVGTVQIIEEPLDTNVVARVAKDAASSDTRHILAVKNLHATLRSGELPEDVGVIHPAYYLLDAELAAAFAAQKQYTADEATLGLKLAWYEPRTQEDIPLHGDERFIWSGKLACTDESAAFQNQFADLPAVSVLNHRQLLEIAANPEHPGYSACISNTHIVIDDASMLEDTATRAYGTQCSLDDLRAAAEGDASLTSLTDLLQLWVEKTRNMHDLYYLTARDAGTPEAKQLLAQIQSLLDGSQPQHVQRLLAAVQQWMQSAANQNWITWIETRQNGSQYLEAVPDRVSALLQENLYSQCRVSLLAPPQSAGPLAEIIPAQVQTTLIPREGATDLAIEFAPDEKPERFIQMPLPGKTVLLMSSRGRIENLFVEFAEEAEKQGTTLICQGLGGGSGRMQAEFCAAEAPAVWVLTPWSFETMELPPNTVDHLIVESLPFDHPAHPVISKRSEHYQDSFGMYSLPRLRHRLHRLLRTFCSFRTSGGDVRFLDQRLESKEYGRRTWEFLKSLSQTQTTDISATEAVQPTAQKQKQKNEDDQLALF